MAPRMLVCGVLLVVLGTSAVLPAAAAPKQVSNTQSCDRDGFSNTSQYRSSVPVAGTGHFLPVYTSVGDLARPLKVASLLLIVHGVGGNANTFFCDALKAAPSGSVGVVAPWFGDEDVRLKTWAGEAAAAGGNPTSLYWQGSEWNQGAAAANAASIASFTALDAVLDLLAANNKPGSGSSLKQVVVAGFSAGAQMVQRYAWATPYGTSGPAAPFSVKFVVSDPSTYLYFDDRRPEPSCTPLRDTGADLRCAKFSRPDAPTCTDFNSYKLGLEGAADASPYLAQARVASNPSALSSAYLQKSILYVFGGADVCNCNKRGYANPGFCTREEGSRGCSPSVAGPTCCDMPAGKYTNSFVDVSCGDMLQGSNRLQRGLLYMDYLRAFSGGQHSPQGVVVLGMGHDQGPMLNSAAFKSFVSA